MTSRDDESAAVPDRLAYSVEEAADRLGIGRTYMYRLLATGEVESFTIGRLRKVRPEALDAYLEGRRSRQPPSPGTGTSRSGPGRGGPGSPGAASDPQLP